MFQNTKLLVVFIFFIIFLGILFLFLTKISVSENPEVPKEEATSSGVLVTKVVDGDTIEIEGGEKVRYLGVDTPETKDPRKPVQCFGKEASNKNKELVEGKRVVLEKDVTNTDKYNRLLRFVFLDLGNGTRLFINDYLIREGYGQVLTIPPDVKYSEQFLAAQKQAREAKLGLWGKCV